MVTIMAQFSAPYLRSIRWHPDADRSDQYPFSLPLLDRDDFELQFLKPVTIIVGENGSGKSTLLEAIASHIGFAAQGGSKNHVYASEGHDPAQALKDALRFSWNKKVNNGFFFRAESFFNFASFLDDKNENDEFWPEGVAYAPYGGKSLNKQSHGEAFLSFFGSRGTGQAIYILDEPEAALSPQRQLALMEMIYAIAINGRAQVILATHSPLLTAMPFAELLSIENGAFHERHYQTTDHYKLYRRFFEAPETIFRNMFREE